MPVHVHLCFVQDPYQAQDVIAGVFLSFCARGLLLIGLIWLDGVLNFIQFFILNWGLLGCGSDHCGHTYSPYGLKVRYKGIGIQTACAHPA